MINYTQICHTSLRTAVSLRAALNKHDTRQSVLQTFISLTKTLVLKKDKQFTSNKESLPPQLTGPIILLGNLPAEVASSTAYWLWVHQGLYCLYPFWSTDRRSHLKKVNENWLAESVRSNDRLKIGRRSEWALYFIRWLTSVKFEFQPSFLRVSTFNRFIQREFQHSVDICCSWRAKKPLVTISGAGAVIFLTFIRGKLYDQ